MPLTAPVLDGHTLPYPSSNVREAVPVVDERTLADGTTARYHRGHKTRVTLRWQMKRADVVELIERLGRIRGTTQYVDQDGTPYVVLVDELDGVDAIPGTDPPVYGTGLVLIERRPR